MSEQVAQPGTVPLGLLRRYLRRQGWVQPVRSQGPAAQPATGQAETLRAIRGRPSQPLFDIWQLVDREGQPIPVMVPVEITAPEYLERVERTINTLATIEKRMPEQVAASIRSLGYDLVYSRVPDALVLDDSIALPIAAKYVDHIQDLIEATATTELRPNPFYGRKNKEAIEYANRCRFGHTFKGSFGFTIESPLEEYQTAALPEMEAAPPFERRVVQRFAHGVMATVQAVQADDLRPIVDNVKMGFGANACEKFAQLITDTSPGGLIFAFAFSPEWAIPSDLAGMSSTELTPATRRLHEPLRVRYAINLSHVQRKSRGVLLICITRPIRTISSIQTPNGKLPSIGKARILMTSTCASLFLLRNIGWHMRHMGKVPR